jgi:hypothetical protein
MKCRQDRHEDFDLTFKNITAALLARVSNHSLYYLLIVLNNTFF